MQTWKALNQFKNDVVPNGIDVIGIDPGKNIGITVLRSGEVPVIHAGKIETENDVALDMFEFMVDFLCQHNIDWNPKVILEGASYNAKFGQVILGEVRTAIKLACLLHGLEVQLVPPMTARKVVLGSGKVKGNEVFPDINPNGADSLVLAMYGVGD